LVPQHSANILSFKNLHFHFHFHHLQPQPTMSARYLPPHLRTQPPSSSPPPAERTPNDGYTLEELAHQFDCKHKVGTLNSNAEKGIDWDHPSLAFIVIFKDQHPHWPPKIFCKTNLNLLPASASAGAGDTANAKENGVRDNDAQDPSEDVSIPLSAPIPIFTQLTPHRFIFTDHHAITHISYLAPQSKELVEMLDTKFSPQNQKRLAESWKAKRMEGLRFRGGGLIDWVFAR